MRARSVRNRDVGLAVALVAGAAGVVQNEPVLLLAATVGLVYSAYEAATDVPDPDLEVVRSVAPASPSPGEDVEVTVTVRNHGVAAMPDVRVVDGVPPRLRVTDGSPRFGTALQPDEDASFTYTVRARRGDHEFRPATVVCRSLPGDGEIRETVDAETSLTCSMDVEEVDLGPQTVPRPGRVDADEAGQGVAFRGVREYQSTDPLSRVDWKRFARTTELATVEFSATRAASVVVLVDARSDFAPRPRAPTASQLSKYAGERVATSLLGEHNHVGASLLGESHYVEPRSHRTQALRIRRFLLHEADPATVDADGDESLLGGFDGRAFFAEVAAGATDGGRSPNGGSDPAARADGGDPEGESDATYGTPGGRSAADLDRRFPDAAQVVFCTPLLDAHSAAVARDLSARGREVTVLSPDVTSTASPGRTVERITRADRLTDLRKRVQVVDWSPDEPLPNALARSTRRWSA